MELPPAANGSPERATAYGWIVFALSFGLLISDYMARQVLNAVFPLLKAEWALSDAQLGGLSSVVAVAVGVLTFPLSLAADRWGRVKSLTAMAVLWSLATLLCGMAQSYNQMFLGRLLVGVGEAAYGSVGIAVVIAVFPSRMRATLSSAFLAGTIFGQVLGVIIGGQVGAAYGWRAAFVVIALMGLALAILYPIIVKESKIGGAGTADRSPLALRDLPSQLFGSRSINLAYVGSGVQLFVTGSITAWLPSFFTRTYAMPIDSAGKTAALYFLISAVGMISCGILSDRLSRANPLGKVNVAIALTLLSAALLGTTFYAAPGTTQLILLGFAAFCVSGVAGISGAMVANLAPIAIHGTAFATLALANNLVGLAPGPFVTGMIADRIGLNGALQLLPLACLSSAACYLMARRSYLADLARVASQLKTLTP
jgi:MFS family permease